MRKILLFSICAFIAVSIKAEDRTLNKLAEVNALWKEQAAPETAALPAWKIQSEREWIATHLELVEQILRSRDRSHLSRMQSNNRLKALDALREYRISRAFPFNDRYNYRTPIFIDPYEHFCAVGALMKATGYERVSRMIAAKSNLAYVRQMNYPELNQWAALFGFTQDELAWIQPGYPPQTTFETLGEGTNNDIYCLYPGSDGNLYAGGRFTQTASGSNISGIARIRKSGTGFVWESLGAGLNGIVNSITEFNGKLWAAGEFTLSGSTALSNVAYFDQGGWQPAGCLYGKVKDLEVYNGELYAAGDFDVCAALAQVDFARWVPSENRWQQYPQYDGHINGLYVWKNKLWLYGDFQSNPGPPCKENLVAYDGNTFTPAVSTCTGNEIHSLCSIEDTLYAGLQFIGPSDTAVIKRLIGNTWETHLAYNTPSNLSGYTGNAMYALLARNGILCYGGDFTYMEMLTWSQNFVANDPLAFQENFGLFNGPVRCMAWWDNKLILGGDFTRSMSQNLAHIAAKSNLPSLESISGILESGEIPFRLMPNPVKAGDILKLKAAERVQQVQVFDPCGKMVFGSDYLNSDEIRLPTAMSEGVYLLSAVLANGSNLRAKLMVK